MESPITTDQDEFGGEGTRPRTGEELEEMFQSLRFHSDMMDRFAQIQRGEYISYSIDEVRL